jgi:hypothetical protein
MTTNHNTPFLLIETPRAGKLNYRHIAPPNLWMNQQQVLAIIEAAREKQEGKNFLAVGHDNVVKQFDGNRAAPELLILAGINTKRLSGQEKKVLRDSLQSLLGQVDKLVTQDIDWNTEGENDPVKSEELTFWFEKYFKDTKHLVWKPKPKWLFSVAVAIIVSITLIFTAVLKLWDDQENQRKDKEDRAKIEAIDKANKEKNKLEILTSICGTMNNDQEKTASEELKNEKFAKLFKDPPSDISVSEVFTMKEKPKELFPASFSENLNKEELKTLIACKRTINTFTDKNQFTCDPLIGDTEIDALKKRIEDYREKNKDFYEGVIEESSKAKYCGATVDDKAVDDMAFLTKCYDTWAANKLKNQPKKSENQRFKFWKNAGDLLENCRKVGS